MDCETDFPVEAPTDDAEFEPRPPVLPETCGAELGDLALCASCPMVALFGGCPRGIREATALAHQEEQAAALSAETQEQDDVLLMNDSFLLDISGGKDEGDVEEEFVPNVSAARPADAPREEVAEPLVAAEPSLEQEVPVAPAVPEMVSARIETKSPTRSYLDLLLDDSVDVVIGSFVPERQKQREPVEVAVEPPLITTKKVVTAPVSIPESEPEPESVSVVSLQKATIQTQTPAPTIEPEKTFPSFEPVQPKVNQSSSGPGRHSLSVAPEVPVVAALSEVPVLTQKAMPKKKRYTPQRIESKPIDTVVNSMPRAKHSPATTVAATVKKVVKLPIKKPTESFDAVVKNITNITVEPTPVVQEKVQKPTAPIEPVFVLPPKNGYEAVGAPKVTAEIPREVITPESVQEIIAAPTEDEKNVELPQMKNTEPDSLFDEVATLAATHETNYPEGYTEEFVKTEVPTLEETTLPYLLRKLEFIGTLHSDNQTPHGATRTAMTLKDIIAHYALLGTSLA